MLSPRSFAIPALFTLLASHVPAGAQMVPGVKVVGDAATLGLDHPATDFTVQETGCTVPANVLWPGDDASVTLRITNTTASPLAGPGIVRTIRYGTRGKPGDIWAPQFEDMGVVDSAPIQINLAPHASTEITVSPKIPATFGGYVLVFELPGRGRRFAASVVRAMRPDDGAVQIPAYALDLQGTSDEAARFFKRVGVKGARVGLDVFASTDHDYARKWASLEQRLKVLQENEITAMVTTGGGDLPMPLGMPRPHLTDDGVFRKTKSDYAWLPAYDGEFQSWVRKVCGQFGWPRGPVNAFELWNEPWEGISISGWGADMLRYRAIYTAMAQGIVQARAADGVQVLIGGCGSSSNTDDKLFPDGSDQFLKWLDFCSIHYQVMAATPALMKDFIHRPGGPVRVWDTESWIANSEDRIGVVVASMHAMGQERAMGVYAGNVYDPEPVTLADGKKSTIVQAWSAAAAVAASTKFVGQRKFRELLFQNGLPWIFVFDGRPGKGADDGTVVVAGDLSGCYSRDLLLFRSVYGLKNRARVRELQAELAAQPANTPDADRAALQAQLTQASILDGGSLTMPDGGGEFMLTDFYGNPIAPENGKITVPLNGYGYYLRTNGAPGSFARLLEQLRKSRIDGYEPVQIIPHDFTARLETHPPLRVTLTNIINRPVSGSLNGSISKTALPAQEITLAPHETREILVKLPSLDPAPNNTYPTHIEFNADADADGAASHDETLHANVISRRTITVDGNLDDWKDVVPQPLAAAGIGASLTEKAWLPFAKFDDSTARGVATGYLAYDATNFYFAARIADSTPDAGMVRFATRDDDSYFYPQTSWRIDDKGVKQKMEWPDGVRRFSYRKRPDLPAGGPDSHDNVQIAFNVLPPDQKPWLVSPPGTPPRWMMYWDSDYEYALNPVAPQYGGGTEIWRLQVPGMPRKHFFPRQPASPFDGPVKNGKLVMRRDGNMRIVEASLPWTEIPDVKKRLDAGETIKFDFRVNDNGDPSEELATGRAVSKQNSTTFHNDWQVHWSNELEFGFEK